MGGADLFNVWRPHRVRVLAEKVLALWRSHAVYRGKNRDRLTARPALLAATQRRVGARQERGKRKIRKVLKLEQEKGGANWREARVAVQRREDHLQQRKKEKKSQIRKTEANNEGVTSSEAQRDIHEKDVNGRTRGSEQSRD